MKKLLFAIALAPSLAFSFGGVVTDPGSYSYYATQIEQAIEQLKVAEDQLKTATDTYESVTSIDERLSGNLQRAQRSLESISDLKESSIKDTRKSIQYAKKALDDLASVSDYKEEVEGQIDDVFKDDTKGWVSVEAQKKASRQKAYKQAVIDAEVAQGKADLQLEHLEELASSANSSDTMKDAQDVTNAILLKMLENQSELIKLMGNISKNIALAKYDGSEKPEETKAPDLTPPSNTKKVIAGCGPFDKGCKRKSIDEMMDDIKASEGQ